MGQAPPQLLRFSREKGTERSPPDLTLPARTLCMLSPIPLTMLTAYLQQWRPCLLPRHPSPLLASCSLGAFSALGRHRTRLCPLPTDSPAGIQKWWHCHLRVLNLRSPAMILIPKAATKSCGLLLLSSAPWPESGFGLLSAGPQLASFLSRSQRHQFCHHLWPNDFWEEQPLGQTQFWPVFQYSSVSDSSHLSLHCPI